MKPEPDKTDIGWWDRWWPRLERLILLLTFACTAAGTFYAVKTSSVAIEQANNSLRPWLSLLGVNATVLKKGTATWMAVEFPFKNIGHVPAFATIQVIPDIGEDDPNRKMSNVVSLLPGETMNIPLQIGEAPCSKILGGEIGYRVHLSARYGLSKKEHSVYSISRTVVLNVKALKRFLAAGQTILGDQIWLIVDTNIE